MWDGSERTPGRTTGVRHRSQSVSLLNPVSTSGTEYFPILGQGTQLNNHTPTTFCHHRAARHGLSVAAETACQCDGDWESQKPTMPSIHSSLLTEYPSSCSVQEYRVETRQDEPGPTIQDLFSVMGQLTRSMSGCSGLVL